MKNEEWKDRKARRSIREILNPKPGAGDVAHFITVRDGCTFRGGGGGCWEITGLREEMSGDVLSVQHTLITQ